jgi:heme-degrading monooxygenase HmoA
MATAGSYPPDEDSMKALHATPGTRVTPGAVSGLDGDAPGGPETAGALSLVYSAFADDAGAQRGYRNFAAMKTAVRAAPGFIRWLTFVDGPNTYALGFWRSADDVAQFARGDSHRSMVREQRDEPFEYSQFAGIWAAHTIGSRTLSCPQCQHATAAPTSRCDECGEPLDDPFGEAQRAAR